MTNIRRVKGDNCRNESGPSRSLPNGSPPFFADGLHDKKTFIAGCTYVQVFVVYSLPYLDWQWKGDAGRTRTERFHILIYC